MSPTSSTDKNNSNKNRSNSGSKEEHNSSIATLHHLTNKHKNNQQQQQQRYNNINNTINNNNKKLTYNRSPLISDGRYLYIISQHKPQHKYGLPKFYVDCYDPCDRMKHLKTLKLNYAEPSKILSLTFYLTSINPQSQFSHNISFLFANRQYSQYALCINSHLFGESLVLYQRPLSNGSYPSPSSYRLRLRYKHPSMPFFQYEGWNFYWKFFA